MRPVLSVVVCICAIGLYFGSSGYAADVQWGKCSEDELSSAECAFIQAPLDPSGLIPGTTKLRVAREVTKPGRPWLLYLSGGPGGAGVQEFFGGGLNLIKELRDRFNLLVYDQRGTGESDALVCEGVDIEPGPTDGDAVRRCAQKLGPDRVFYTTKESVADIEFLRQQLGLGTLTLYGTSYGTKLALSYAQAHPNGVKRMILDGVQDPNSTDSLFVGFYAAVRASLRNYCAKQCRGVTRDPVRDLSTLITKLQKRPVRGVIYGDNNHRWLHRITPTDLRFVILSGDTIPAFRFALPAAVRAALGNNDPAPLARLVSLARKSILPADPKSLSEGRFLATNCAEVPLPWPANTPIPRRAAVAVQTAQASGPETFAPFTPSQAAKVASSACGEWPTRTPLPVQRSYPNVPTLIYQGTEDTRTPPSESERVAVEIPGAQRVVMPGYGHGGASQALVFGRFENEDCPADRLDAFLSNQGVANRCPAKVGTGRTTRFSVPPKSLDALKGVKGVPKRLGLVIAGIKATLKDLEQMEPLRPSLTRELRGIHGGIVKDTNIASSKKPLFRSVFKNYSYIRGFKLNGRELKNNSIRLRVSGSRTLPARVTVNRALTRLKGRVANQRVVCDLRGRGRCRALP